MFRQSPLNITSNWRESPRKNLSITQKTKEKQMNNSGNAKNKQEITLFIEYQTFRLKKSALTIAKNTNRQYIKKCQIKTRWLSNKAMTSFYNNSDSNCEKRKTQKPFWCKILDTNTTLHIWTVYSFKTTSSTGNVNHIQILLLKHMLQKLLESLHGEANRHPGIAKMLQKIYANTTILEMQKLCKKCSRLRNMHQRQKKRQCFCKIRII